MKSSASDPNPHANLDIIAFKLGEQTFCIETTSVREIRGWAASTPLPHSSPEVLGVINLRGTVIPTIDLGTKLGLRSSEKTERSAIIVVEVYQQPMGLVVDHVTDMLSVSRDLIQPAPDLGSNSIRSCCDGIITHASAMICFLNLRQMFGSMASEAA